MQGWQKLYVYNHPNKNLPQRIVFSVFSFYIAQEKLRWAFKLYDKVRNNLRFKNNIVEKLIRIHCAAIKHLLSISRKGTVS
jgi:hypothetical protein